MKFGVMRSAFGEEKRKFGEIRKSEVGTEEREMDEGKFDFESLRVYQRALEYVDFVYEITKDFPKTEVFSLTDQFKRASISICLNIAEGSGGSKGEFNQFLKIARRSIRECVAITDISSRRKFIDDNVRQQSRIFCSDLSKMVNGLIKSLK